MNDLVCQSGRQMGKTLVADLPVNIEDTANLLRAWACRLNTASWKLDSAMSMLRKAKAGYRSSTLLGDYTWEIAMYENRVRCAQEEANAILATMPR